MVKEITISSRIVHGFTARHLRPEEYQEVEGLAAIQFGRSSRAYETIMNGIDPSRGTGSQFFFNTQVGLYLPTGRVATTSDWGKISDEEPQFFDESFYTDAPTLILRSETPTWRQNGPILEDLVSQVKERGLEFSPENPLAITGLGLRMDERVETPYGVLLNFTDDTVAVNDPQYESGNNSIKIGNTVRTLWTKEDGLSGVYLSRGGDVYANDDGLASSDDDGRVVVFDAEGVADENNAFTKAKKAYHAKLRAIREEIDRELA